MWIRNKDNKVINGENNQGLKDEAVAKDRILKISGLAKQMNQFHRELTFISNY